MGRRLKKLDRRAGATMNPQEHLAFRALAHPIRRDILVLLASRDMTIGEVADNYQMTRAAVKKHLTALSEGELIEVRTVGRARVNALRKQGMQSVFNWFSYFDRFWDDKLSTLKTTIEKDTS